LADLADKASLLEQHWRENAIKNQQQQKVKPLIVDGVRCCLVCEEHVLPARIASVNAVRCIGCQVIYEANQKHQRK
jgi:hypothetical protein